VQSGYFVVTTLHVLRGTSVLSVVFQALQTAESLTMFYLGTHKPQWLWSTEAAFPLFASYRIPARYRNLQPATHCW